MKFTFSNLPATGWALPAGRIADLARLCEDVGFDRFAVADLPFHYDCVAVVTAHSGIDYERLVDEAQLVVDLRNATRAAGRTNGKVWKL